MRVCVLASLVGSMGCGGSVAPADAGEVALDASSTDAGSTDASAADASATDAAVRCGPPDDPSYGVTVGEHFPPVEAVDCEDAPTSFYGQCDPDRRLTVVNVAAGWCLPCNEESEVLTAQLTEPYRERGVRVVQLLVADYSGAPPSPTFCASWVASHELTNEVWRDTNGSWAALWPGGLLPVTYIVDEEGIVRYWQNATPDGLDSIVEQVELLLAEP